MAKPHPALALKWKVLGGLAAALALVPLLFDWNWMRPAVEHYLSRTSQREVRAEHLSMTGLLTLEPTVTLRGVYVQNAPWADTQHPMATAGEVSFTFSIRSVIDDRTVISKIVLKDADIDMEKQADGLRNWRLKKPDDRGPPAVKVLSLEAYRSKLRFVDRDPDHAFDIRFASSEPAKTAGIAAGSSNAATLPLVNRIEAEGTYRGARFSADTLTSAELTFRDTQRFFALRGHAVAGGTRLEMDGQAADMFVRPLLDASVRVTGATLAQLHPFILLQPPQSRPYRFEAHVRRTKDEYFFENLRGAIGETDLAGSASHLLDEQRHQWRANLKSGSANFYDLASLVGVNPPGAAPRKGAPADKLFPVQPIRPERLRAQDLRVQLEVKKLDAPGLRSAESVRFDAALVGGVLEVKGFILGLAGGRAEGQVSLDARTAVPRGRAALKLAGLRLERLFPKLPPDARHTGPLHGVLDLQGTGDSIAAMLGNASGKLDLGLEGGRISNKLDAKLSLNLGKLAGLFFKGDRDIPIYCAVASFDFHGGNGKARSLLVETEQTRIVGAGSLNLREEKPDLLLVPQPKQPGLLTLGATIRVEGTFRHPAFGFHEGRAGAPALSANAHCPVPPVALASVRR